MGRKTKLQSHPGLAKPHDAGATVALLQILAHAQYGGIAYGWSEFWVFEANLADESFIKLKELHQEVLKFQPGASNMRSIYDLEFLEDIYCAGTDMVSHASRSVQHLAECIERVKGVSLRATTATERIKEAAALLGLNDHQTDPGYQGLVEILKIRDAIEHPKESNVFQGGDLWDEVPLAWMLSERGLQAYERYSSWRELLVTNLEAYIKALPPRTITLTVERGIESKLHSKKPLTI